MTNAKILIDGVEIAEVTNVEINFDPPPVYFLRKSWCPPCSGCGEPCAVQSDLKHPISGSRLWLQGRHFICTFGGMLKLATEGTDWIMHSEPMVKARFYFEEYEIPKSITDFFK